MNVQPLPSAGATLWSRLSTTPLFDLLRGRLTGSLDLRGVIAAATLPEPLNHLIRQVARRTRLWRIERVDVARELAEHFRDGIDAGRTAEELALSFGDPRQAARLIRRAKLRARPLFWRIWRRGVQVLGAVAALLVGCYLFLAIRLMSAHPTLSHNYSLELVAPTQGVSEADRAWPFYREAMLEMTPEPKVFEEGREPAAGDNESLPEVAVDVLTERPGSKHWHEVEHWLDTNRAAIELARQGGARPRFGFVYNDPANGAWLAKEHFDPKDIDLNKNDMVIAFLLPQHQNVRGVARLLEADARRAVAAGDRKTFVGDVAALVGMAEQLRNDVAFLVVDLISYNIFDRALLLVDEVLNKQAAVLEEEDFGHLAHLIASYAGGGQIVARLTGERADFHDFVQRICSDDGQGGGVLTHEGVEFLKHFRHELGDSGSAEPFTAALLAPLAAGIISRREMVERGDALFDRAEAEFQRPLWQWNADDFDAELQQLAKNPINHVRHAPLLILMPAVKGCYPASQRLTQERDATLVALALTLFHRRHGAWPERLDELVPDLLPKVPLDRFTGQPLHYRLVNGEPLVYSVGIDKEDNGGEPAKDPQHQGAAFYHLAIHRRTSQAATAKEDIGWDWVLWPPLPEVDSTEEPSRP